ncbi:unnamed protein product [Caenorhabditis angaria]|uniref:Uncharacterized protein n=1 Tax=Caenorhabditis angaria TaxID=860376 RepID=A0A9P1MVC9_9PELO|nr:unnamed protein product [Caenorhabditis angaria]
MKVVNRCQKKTHSINGETVAQKVDWTREHLEKQTLSDTVSSQDGIIDTKGHGFKLITGRCTHQETSTRQTQESPKRQNLTPNFPENPRMMVDKMRLP